MKHSGSEYTGVRILMTFLIVGLIIKGILTYGVEQMAETIQTKIETTISNHISDMTGDMVDMEWQ
jgi:hypothetical protein